MLGTQAHLKAGGGQKVLSCSFRRKQHMHPDLAPHTGCLSCRTKCHRRGADSGGHITEAGGRACTLSSLVGGSGGWSPWDWPRSLVGTGEVATAVAGVVASRPWLSVVCQLILTAT